MRGTAALTAVHKKFPDGVSKKNAFGLRLTRVPHSNSAACLVDTARRLATRIALLKCSPHVWHCTGATSLGWSLLVVALMPLQPCSQEFALVHLVSVKRKCRYKQQNECLGVSNIPFYCIYAGSAVWCLIPLLNRENTGSKRKPLSLRHLPGLWDGWQTPHNLQNHAKWDFKTILL